MFHWTPEGCALKSGLNFYISLPYWVYSKKSFIGIRFIGFTRIWFRFVWVSVDLATSNVKTWYFRCRPYQRPWFVRDVTEHNIIAQYKCSSSGKFLTYECYMDNVANMTPGLIEDIDVCTKSWEAS